MGAVGKRPSSFISPARSISRAPRNLWPINGGGGAIRPSIIWTRFPRMGRRFSLPRRRFRRRWNARGSLYRASKAKIGGGLESMGGFVFLIRGDR